jgi:hypothetical protein
VGFEGIEEEEEVEAEVKFSLGTSRNCHRFADEVPQVEEASNRAMARLRKCLVSAIGLCDECSC